MRGENDSNCVVVGDMFRSKLNGDMFCIKAVLKIGVIIESVYSENTYEKLLGISSLIEEHIKYDF